LRILQYRSAVSTLILFTLSRQICDCFDWRAREEAWEYRREKLSARAFSGKVETGVRSEKNALMQSTGARSVSVGIECALV